MLQHNRNGAGISRLFLNADEERYRSCNRVIQNSVKYLNRARRAVFAAAESYANLTPRRLTLHVHRMKKLLVTHASINLIPKLNLFTASCCRGKLRRQVYRTQRPTIIFIIAYSTNLNFDTIFPQILISENQYFQILFMRQKKINSPL